MVKITQLYDSCKDPEEILKALQDAKLIPKEIACPKCENPMQICKFDRAIDKFCWRCRARYQPWEKAAYVQCDTKRSIRTGTFFARSKMSLFKVTKREVEGTIVENFRFSVSHTCGHVDINL